MRSIVPTMLNRPTSGRARLERRTTAQRATSARMAASRSPYAAGFALLGQVRKYRSRSEKHQSKMPHRMQQQYRDHDRPRLEPGKHRQQIKLGRDRKYDSAEQQIDGEDVHLRQLRCLNRRLLQTIPAQNRSIETSAYLSALWAKRTTRKPAADVIIVLIVLLESRHTSTASSGITGACWPKNFSRCRS